MNTRGYYQLGKMDAESGAKASGVFIGCAIQQIRAYYRGYNSVGKHGRSCIARYHRAGGRSCISN